MKYLLLILFLATAGLSQEPVRLMLVGPPGAGKGTQARFLAEKLHAAHLSTGDMLRSQVKEGTALGKEAKSYMDAGKLVPDSLLLAMVREQLEKNPAFILDGFPRTVPQAEQLDKMLAELKRPLTMVVLVDVPDEVLVERLALRRFCPQCQRTYHLKSNPPHKAGLCDADGTALIQRKDDDAAVIRKRLEVYHEQTAPILAYYGPKGLVQKVDGSLPVDQVEARMLEVVGRVPASK